MKNKGFIKFFTIALAAVCLFQLSFSLVTAGVESDAKEYAQGDREKERKYLDSMSRQPVYNLLFKNYTYKECKEHELNMGLDLQGGMNVTLEVSIKDVVKAMSNHNPDPTLNKAIENAAVAQVKSQKDYVTLFGEEFEKLSPGGKLAPYFASRELKDRISLNSSNSEVLRVLREEANDALSRSYEILTTRIDRFGVTQPNIQKLENSGRILVELPGIDDPQRVRKLLQGSAQLEFWECYQNDQTFLGYLEAANKKLRDIHAGDASTDSTDTAAAAAPLLSGSANDTTAVAKNDTAATAKKDSAALAGSDTSAAKTPEEMAKENPLYAKLIPMVNMESGEIYPGAAVGSATYMDTAAINTMLHEPEMKSIFPKDMVFAWSNKASDPNEVFYTLFALRSSKGGKPALDGEVVADARKDLAQNGAAYEVTMIMTPNGAKEWRRITKDNVNKPIAIVLDGAVYSAPNVINEIPNGRSSITGNFTASEAEDLANILKAGKMPAPARIVEEAVVGPSLGQDAINSGLMSLVIGTIVILLFMVIYYNKGGFVADIAVIINLFFIIGILASMGAALTLPGIAGIVLTLGMAVDANVLVNERIKEELAAGLSLKNAIAKGYQNAASAVIDSNLTTLIAGFALLLFGKGPVYGFAVTLIMGIFTSLFTSIVLTRFFFEWWESRGRKIDFTTSISRSLFKNPNYNVVGRRKIYYLISGVIIVAGIVSLFTKGISRGIDFEGGRSYIVGFEGEPDYVKVRESLTPLFGGNAPEVKNYEGSNKLKITTNYLLNDPAENASQQVDDALNKGLSQYSDLKPTILSTAVVGATVASDVQWAALWAILISIVGIFLYIVIRFRSLEFGLGAIVALAHDVMVIFSLFSLLDGVVPFSLTMDQNFIAAVLTTLGYSINDTVVVFDRLREFLGKRKGQEDFNYDATINSAINDTFSRTMITSVTVIMVLLILFILGGETLKGFSFAMLVGVIFGTFSSICVATPVVVDFHKLLVKRKK